MLKLNSFVTVNFYTNFFTLESNSFLRFSCLQSKCRNTRKISLLRTKAVRIQHCGITSAMEMSWLFR